eukprot:Gb_09924 [translate_table: standard]
MEAKKGLWNEGFQCREIVPEMALGWNCLVATTNWESHGLWDHPREDIRALFPLDCNPFYAGFGNRDTDEISYLKVGIPKGKIFIINPKGEVAVNHRVDVKSYTSLHTLVNDMFPPMSTFEQEDYNSWNYWKVPLPDIDVKRESGGKLGFNAQSGKVVFYAFGNDDLVKSLCNSDTVSFFLHAEDIKRLVTHKRTDFITFSPCFN